MAPGAARLARRVGFSLVWLALAGCNAASALRGADFGAVGAVGAVGVGAADGGGNPQHGQRLLAQYQCGSCHTIPGVAASRGTLGPSLAAFGSRSYIAGSVPNGADVLARFITDPKEVVPDTPMPDMGVSPFDARDIVAYLGTLR